MTEHQAAMLHLLSETDRICQKYGIHYMLFAGTLLGAVRHHGFIPWDDDMDVIMLRPEYERFLAVAKIELDQDKFFLQPEYSEHWPIYFSKLRLQNTAAIEKYHPKDPLVHQGIYIDLFPCDNLSDNLFMRKIQFVSSKVVIAKGLYKRGYETNSIKKKLFVQCCRILPVKPFIVITQLKKSNHTQMVHCFLGAASRYERSIFQRIWMTESVSLEFEGCCYPASAHYDSLLTQLYGDYMTPPTDAQRTCKVHAVIADVHNGYQNYLKQQADMKITSYTRSIR